MTSCTQAYKKVQRRVVRGLDDDEVMSFGEYSAQENGRTVYGAIPGPVATEHRVEQGTKLAVGYHPPTGSVILTPVRDDN